MIVPFRQQEVQPQAGPEPNPNFVLMAAAMMHREGRLDTTTPPNQNNIGTGADAKGYDDGSSIPLSSGYKANNDSMTKTPFKDRSTTVPYRK